MGWGNAIDKVLSFIPGREESIRNKIDKLKRERDEITKNPADSTSEWRYEHLSQQLRELEGKLKNR